MLKKISATALILLSELYRIQGYDFHLTYYGDQFRGYKVTKIRSKIQFSLGRFHKPVQDQVKIVRKSTSLDENDQNKFVRACQVCLVSICQVCLVLYGPWYNR